MAKPKLFEGKSPVQNAWWISRVFFTWVSPVMSYAQKYEEMTIDSYGKIRDKDLVDHQIEKLRSSWNARVARGT